MKNIYAFTEVNTTPPGYISINEELGKITVSVRTRGAQVPSTIEMTQEELKALAYSIEMYLGPADALQYPLPLPAEQSELAVDAKLGKSSK